MVRLAEESDAQILVGILGVVLTLLGGLFLGFAALTSKVIREEDEEGRSAEAQKVRRTRAGSIAIGGLLVGVGVFLFFS
ncbi:hypothetical protein GCM10009646_65690 [Streptomyces aureus]